MNLMERETKYFGFKYIYTLRKDIKYTNSVVRV